MTFWKIKVAFILMFLNCFFFLVFFHQLKKIHFLPLSESCPNYLFKVSTDEFISIPGSENAGKRLTSISLNNEEEVSYTLASTASEALKTKEVQMYSTKVKIKVRSNSCIIQMFHGSTQVGQWSAPSPITCLDVISNDDNEAAEAANSKKRKKRYLEDGELATAGKLVVGDRAGGLHILTAKKLLG